VVRRNWAGHDDPAVRGDLPAPAKPNVRFTLERRLHGNFKTADARLGVFLGNGYSYSKL
jgi:hypothetical protein